MRGICTLAVVLLAAGSRLVSAQTVRGTVVVDGGRPLSGVVVALVDATQKEVGRALTNEQGEYRLTAPRPGNYRIRTLRIGFQSLVTEPIALAAGDDITRPLAVSTLVFSLDTVRSTGRNACKVVAGDSTSVVAATWDQVRSALIATQLTLARRTMQSTSINYDRMLDVRSRRIGSQMIDVRTEFATQPWRSFSAAELRKNGYVYTADDSSRVYHSPDLTVLLSDEFIEDHCLRISKESDARRLGIDFEPTPARRDFTEIRGTLWLDRKTNELQEMEHRYINRIRLDEERIAGGEMGFSRMRNGGWVISRWNIHMPVQALIPVYSPTMAVINHVIRLDSIKQTGGELVMAVTTGNRRDTIWMRPPVSVRGTVLDSLSGQPVARAIVGLAGTIHVDTTDSAGRFTIGGILPGRYSLNVTTPSLDSLNTVDQRSVLVADSSMSLTVRVPNATMIAGAVCGKDNTATRLGAGILLGSVVRRDSTPVANASIAAQWNEITLNGGAVGNRIREAQTKTDARGVFRICGMPTATSFTVYAKADSAEAAPVSVKLAGDQLFGRADLVIDRAAAATAKFTGVVVDSTGKPLPDADVQVTDLALSGSTGADGKFVIPGVAAGNHSVMIRKVGYGPLEAKLDFAAGDATDRRIMLTQITVLDTVRSEANLLLKEAPLLREFEENRKIGLGKFYTRADLAKAEGRSMASLFEAPGFITVTLSGGSWIKSTRTRTTNPHCYELEDAIPPITPRGVNCGCFPIVFLDFQRLSDVTRVPNINRYRAMELEAVEFYRSGAETPQRYAILNSECGVIVMHSRRTDVKPEKPDTGKAKARPPTGSFSGVVVDTAGNPLANADILITDLALSGSSEATGSFVVSGIAPGNHAVTVRKIGYGQMDAKLDFTSGAFTDRRIVLSRIVVLDSMLSEGKGLDPQMKLFDERRKIGLGHFVTKDYIVKFEALRLTNFITQMPAVVMIPAGNEEYLESKRAMHSSCNKGLAIPRNTVRESPLGECVWREGIYYVPTTEERRYMNWVVGCYARVYLDNQLLNPGRIGAPIAMRELPAPNMIEAIEWYTGPAEMPYELMSANSSCGALVVHLRRKK